MQAGNKSAIFLWKPNPSPKEVKSGCWTAEQLTKFVDRFDSGDSAKEWWQCRSTKAIQGGDRAYLLQSGKPRRGLLGRGRVVTVDKEKKLALLQFERGGGDVLWRPGERLPVDEKHLLSMSFKTPISSGVPLKVDFQREFDLRIDEFVARNSNRATPLEEGDLDEESQKITRLNKLMEQRTRPEQRAFREKVLRNYNNRCAVTECVTPAALEAAHIRVLGDDQDENSPANGILLRSDIHALFDALLITLSEDGTRIEASPQVLADQSYAFLRTAVVTRPDHNPPSAENIREHRKQFHEPKERSPKLNGRKEMEWR